MDIRIESLLAKIEEIESSFGSGIYASINDSDEKTFKQWIKKNFPESQNDFSDYIAFSRISDGLIFDGLRIFSINHNARFSLYDENETLWELEHQRQYLFFGDDSISWFCMDLLSNDYLIIDKPGGQIMGDFKTFDDLIFRALKGVEPK